MAELGFYEQIIEDMARSVLRSEEMRTALEKTGLSVDALVRQAVEEVPSLIATADIKVQSSVSVPEILAAWFSPWRTRIVAMVAMVAVAGALGVAAAEGIGWTPPTALVLVLLAAVVVSGAEGARPLTGELDSVSRLSLEQQVLAPFLRRRISSFVKEDQQGFHVTSAPGLSDLSGRDQIAATAAGDRLTRIFRTMTAGSIAISGPRGAGKTTLLRQFCDSPFAGRTVPELCFMVSAPVVYDIHDFVVHLYRQLCLSVVQGRPDRGRPRDPGRSRRRTLVIPVLSFVAGIAGFGYVALRHLSHVALLQGAYLLAGGSLMSLGGMASTAPYLVRERRTDRAPAKRIRRAATAFPGVVVAVFGAGLIYWTLSSRPRRMPDTPSVVTICSSLLIVNAFVLLTVRARRRDHDHEADFEDEARRRLQQLQFLQTFNTGYSGTVAIPGGVQLGRTASRQLAEQKLSLPEIIEQYRDFAHRAAQWWRAKHDGKGRLVIGIDEVDKIRDAPSAEQFVNDIKAVFGTPHCLYLVSVSDEAMLGFQQLSPELRVAFDSAFDEMVRVDHLSLSDVRGLLRRRVAGITDPFVALCYALSGGLPRDVLRIARALVEIRSREGATGDIRDLTTALVAHELSLTKHALLRGRTGNDTTPEYRELLKRLVDDSWPRDLMKGAVTCEQSGDDATSRWLSVALRFLATVEDAFGAGVVHAIEDPSVIDVLARARIALAIDAGIAAELISRFRADGGLPPFD